jgi:hypothetical protein
VRMRTRGARPRSARRSTSTTPDSRRLRLPIDSVLEAVDAFYADVLGQLKAWTAAPPKLREETTVDSDPAAEPSLASTSLSSQDGPAPDDDAVSATTTPSASSKKPEEKGKASETPLAWQAARDEPESLTALSSEPAPTSLST